MPDQFPPVFTKYRTALSDPQTTVTIPEGGNVDWEVELVVVIGRRAERVAATDALVLRGRPDGPVITFVNER